jgi:hypothetical protein
MSEDRTGSSPPSAPRAELVRGEAHRRPARLTIRHDLVATLRGAIWPERVHTLSATGISLALDRRMDAGTEVSLNLYHIPRDFSCTLPLRVISTIEHPDGLYITGGAFTRELSDEEKRRLML